MERAFMLARSGDCANVDAIVRILKLEGYDQNQIEGKSLKKQLNALIQLAQKQAVHT